MRVDSLLNLFIVDVYIFSMSFLIILLVLRFYQRNIILSNSLMLRALNKFLYFISLYSLIGSFFICFKKDYVDLELTCYNFFMIGWVEKQASLVILLLSIIILIYSYKYLLNEMVFISDFLILYHLSIFLMLVMVKTVDLFMFYFIMEALSLILYIFASFKNDTVLGLEAGIKYFITGAYSSIIFALGLTLFYGTFGTLNLIDLLYLISSLSHNDNINIIKLALICFLIGFFFKLTIVPLHKWAPAVYLVTALPIFNFLSTLPKYVFVFIFLKFFSISFYDLQSFWYLICWLGAIFSFIYSSLILFEQTNIRKFLAYTSINHMAFILLALSIGSLEGLYAAVFYMFGYLLMLFAFFYFLYLDIDFRKSFIEYKKLKYLSPLLSVFFICLLLSLAGIPPFIGFWSKYYVITALFYNKNYFTMILALLTSVAGIIYYLKLIKIIYFDNDSNIGMIKPYNIDNVNLWVLIILFIPIIGFCVFSTLVLKYIEHFIYLLI